MELPSVCNFDYSGRVVLVTGGTAGIGQAIAQGYLRAGARVYVTGRKDSITEYGPVPGRVAAISSVVGTKSRCHNPFRRARTGS